MAKTASIETELDKLRRGIKNVKTKSRKPPLKKKTSQKQEGIVTSTTIDEKIEIVNSLLDNLVENRNHHEDIVSKYDYIIRNLEDVLDNLQNLKTGDFD